MLDEGQEKAVKAIKNGSVICGRVGSGKSRVGLAYYFRACQAMKINPPLYIITTALKRDRSEWDVEIEPFVMDSGIEPTVVVDSWNNIGKYKNITGSFFIFDEQRAIGKGAWSKSFVRIAKNNRWIMLSATPGDKWEDYIPLFLAEGFYKSRRDFVDQHIEYDPRVKNFPKIRGYHRVKKLEKLRESILVNIEYTRKAIVIDEYVEAKYDKLAYKKVWRTRVNPENDEPIMNISALCYTLRKIGNNDPSRLTCVGDIISKHKKAIIFYNFNYELENIRNYLDLYSIAYKEWNGHKHEEVPKGKEWAYLVQYSAGAEGWNCRVCDTIIFYSASYSYKQTVQAAGRIDRRDSPYDTLYYYHIWCKSPIDIAILRCLKQKKDFNEKVIEKAVA